MILLEDFLSDVTILDITEDEAKTMFKFLGHPHQTWNNFCYGSFTNPMDYED
jgi:hypothetical protein